MKNINNENDEFLENVKTVLDHGAESIDRTTQHRLNEIRTQSLQMKSPKNEVNNAPWYAWSGAGALSVALLIAAVWLLNPFAQMSQPEEQWNQLSLELMSGEAISDDDIEMLEDIDFVVWLMEQENGNAS